eukprot:TRINITY_DN49676_c0_g1_i1.p1 TRINITY_DN49676_c0_g1~~TRINITY_DN49676_c0_g1_i1.p1  ORF type:complete len:436 (+),score=88.56 TRINITY_DN49676_c0_g1_i1:2-1309(+)
MTAATTATTATTTTTAATAATATTTTAATSGGRPLSMAEFENFYVANVAGEEIPELVLEHEFSSCQVRIQLRSQCRPRDVLARVAELSPEDRATNLSIDDGTLRAICKVLDAQGLSRLSSERDIAFAVRLGRSLCNGYKYDVAATEARLKHLPRLIWEEKKGDCSAFNAGFVYALRAYGIPARISLGFKYGKAVDQACGSVVAPHAQSEFFAEGIGWVPCDATMGVRRLGHEASSMLSFVEWRPASMSVNEAEEMAKVFSDPSDPLKQQVRLREALVGHAAKRKDKLLSPRFLSDTLRQLERLDDSAATEQVSSVLQSHGLANDARIGADEFLRSLSGLKLGRFQELGTGSALAEASRAGVKAYEGGPYSHRGEALDIRQLNENMIVPVGIDQVLDHVEAKSSKSRGSGSAIDWSQHWPYGVFLCSYEFEEKPLR